MQYPRHKPSYGNRERPRISLDALTDLCYAVASGYDTAMRELMHRALREYSGKEMQWHEDYVEAVVSDVVRFAEEEAAASLQGSESEARDSGSDSTPPRPPRRQART